VQSLAIKHFKQAGIILLVLLGPVLRSCQTGPSPELLASIEEGIEHYNQKHENFQLHLNQIRSLKDSLFYDRLLQTLSEEGKEKFIQTYQERPQELPQNLPRFDLLKKEFEKNLQLYSAFLREFKLSLIAVENWREGLPASEKTHREVRQQWEAYKRELNQDIKQDKEIMQNIRDLEKDFNRNLRRLRKQLQETS
jgi:hypothetical protein